MSDRIRNEWIDLGRAGGAVAIALFHFNVMPVALPDSSVARLWHQFWLHGHFAVPVFFLLGGYCAAPGWSRSADARSFLLHRLRRIAIPYWASLFLVLLIAVVARLATGINDVASFPRTSAGIVATLLLLTEPATAVATVNWVYWYLTCAVAFDLFLASTLTVSPALRGPAFALLHFSLCLSDVILRPAPHGAGLFIHYWPQFALGMAVALARVQNRWGTIAFATSALHAAWALTIGRDANHYLAVALLAAALLMLAASMPFFRGLQWTGRIAPFSYSLFLIHVPVGILGGFRFVPKDFSHAGTYIGIQVLWLGILSLAAYLFRHATEHPLGLKRIAS